MTLEKAIKIKSLTGEEFLKADPDEIDEAERLSIKALERELYNRLHQPDLIFGKLPSETED